MARKRKRKSFGSSAAIHTQQATKAVEDIGYFAALVVNRSRNSKCGSALISYAEMQQAIGRYDANTKAGGKAWKPVTAIREAAAEFSDRCVTAFDQRTGANVSGRRRRKARRR